MKTYRVSSFLSNKNEKKSFSFHDPNGAMSSGSINGSRFSSSRPSS